MFVLRMYRMIYFRQGLELEVHFVVLKKESK